MPESRRKAEASRREGSADDDAKIIVRSNGTVTYVGKDIAYQLWKFGLLGKDFHYRRFHTTPEGHNRLDTAARTAPKAARPNSATRTASTT